MPKKWLTEAQAIDVRQRFLDGATKEEICLATSIKMNVVENLIYNHTYLGLGPDVSKLNRQRRAERIATTTRMLREGVSVKKVAAHFGVGIKAVYRDHALYCPEVPLIAPPLQRTLNYTKAQNIRAAHAAGKSITLLAKQYGVSYNAIRYIIKGIRWTKPRRNTKVFLTYKQPKSAKRSSTA